jgi:beta-lactam-binding protein with PASTA domain
VRAGCNLGRVRFVTTKRLAPMRVVKQGRRAGKVLPGGTPVDLVVSRRPKAKPAQRARTSRR